MTESDELAAEFETQRAYLHAVAFRMLGSHADADDAVQEAWLRLARAAARNRGPARLAYHGDRPDLPGCAPQARGAGRQPLELTVGMLPREVAGNSRIDPEEEARSRTPLAWRCTS